MNIIDATDELTVRNGCYTDIRCLPDNVLEILARNRFGGPLCDIIACPAADEIARRDRMNLD